MNAIPEPTRHKITVDEYERLGEAGVLHPDSRIELIDGDLIDMPPIGTPHASVSIRLTRLFITRAGHTAIVSAAHPMRLPPWSMPQPDFMLLKPRADDYAAHHPSASDVLLAVEVADSSLRFDLSVKSRLYAASGVREYWIIEARSPRLHRFRDPVSATRVYSTQEVLEGDFSISPLLLPELSLLASEIWPPTATR
jgi:Uma2 family endonuclease